MDEVLLIVGVDWFVKVHQEQLLSSIQNMADSTNPFAQDLEEKSSQPSLMPNPFLDPASERDVFEPVPLDINGSGTSEGQDQQQPDLALPASFDKESCVLVKDPFYGYTSLMNHPEAVFDQNDASILPQMDQQTDAFDRYRQHEASRTSTPATLVDEYPKSSSSDQHNVQQQEQQHATSSRASSRLSRFLPSFVVSRAGGYTSAIPDSPSTSGSTAGRRTLSRSSSVHSANGDGSSGVQLLEHEAVKEYLRYAPSLTNDLRRLAILMLGLITSYNMYGSMFFIRSQPDTAPHLSWLWFSPGSMMLWFACISAWVYSGVTWWLWHRQICQERIPERLKSFFVRRFAVITFLKGAFTILAGFAWNRAKASGSADAPASSELMWTMYLARPLVGGICQGVAMALVSLVTMLNANQLINPSVPSPTSDPFFRDRVAQEMAKEMWRVFAVGLALIPGLLTAAVGFATQLISQFLHGQDKGTPAQQMGDYSLMALGGIGCLISLVYLILDIRATRYYSSPAYEIEMNDLKDNHGAREEQVSFTFVIATLRTNFFKMFFSGPGILYAITAFFAMICFSTFTWWFSFLVEEAMMFERNSALLVQGCLILLSVVLTSVFVYVLGAPRDQEKSDEAIVPFMFKLVMFVSVFCIIGVFGVFFGAYIVPNGGNMFLAFVGALATTSIGVIPLISFLFGSNAGQHACIEIARWTRTVAPRFTHSPNLLERSLLLNVRAVMLKYVIWTNLAFLYSLPIVAYLFTFSKWYTLERYKNGKWSIGMPGRSAEWAKYFAGIPTNTTGPAIPTAGNSSLGLLIEAGGLFLMVFFALGVQINLTKKRDAEDRVSRARNRFSTLNG